MLDALVAVGRAQTEPVRRALGRVARHEFVPEAGLEAAYAASDTVVIKRDSSGVALSSASAPDVVAAMLDQLQVAPGQRVLEIGTGTGYNAALLAELVGDQGEVVSVEVDPEVVARAQRALSRTGYGHVVVLAQDGAAPLTGQEPFDRIVVTAGAWDIPPAWFGQLRSEGRLVVPLRWRGQTQSVALAAAGDAGGSPGSTGQVLQAVAMQLCGFIPMVGPSGERTADLDRAGHLSVTFDVDQDIDPALLCEVFAREPQHHWSNVMIGGQEPVDRLWLRMTAREPNTCRFAATSTAISNGLPAPVLPARAAAIAERSSISYLTARPRTRASPGSRHLELGAVGYGPHGDQLAERIVEHLRAWDSDRTACPELTIHSGGPAADTPTGLTITKTHSSLTLRI